jgi:hypothetical protein
MDTTRTRGPGRWSMRRSLTRRHFAMTSMKLWPCSFVAPARRVAQRGLALRRRCKASCAEFARACESGGNSAPPRRATPTGTRCRQELDCTQTDGHASDLLLPRQPLAVWGRGTERRSFSMRTHSTTWPRALRGHNCDSGRPVHEDEERLRWARATLRRSRRSDRQRAGHAATPGTTGACETQRKVRHVAWRPGVEQGSLAA